MARSVTEIQAAIAEADASISAALKASKYSLDTGQGRQSVERVDLAVLIQYRKDLVEELEEATGPQGLITGTFCR